MTSSLDFRAREIAAACLVALVVQAGAALALGSSDNTRPAEAPEIDRGTAAPVKIVPVLDLESPLLKLGGKPDPSKLPDRWTRQAPKPRVEQRAFVSPTAGKTEADIPAPEVKMAEPDAGPPPPEAEIAKEVESPPEITVDAGAPANVETVGHADGVKEGTEEDPLKARVVDLYRARISGWFSRRFRVTGSGLSADELGRHRVSAKVEVDAERRVVGFSVTPCGNAAFDAAASRALDSAKGETLPPPPEGYPEAVQRQISLTFVCRENRCD